MWVKINLIAKLGKKKESPISVNLFLTKVTEIEDSHSPIAVGGAGKIVAPIVFIIVPFFISC